MRMEWYVLIAGVLVLIGVGLLLVEFLFPTGGVTVVIAVGLFAAAVGTIFYGGSLIEGVIAMVGLSLGLPVAGSLMFAGWKRLALKSSLDPDHQSSTMADLPEIAKLNDYIGLTGRTVTMMRPAGIVLFEGKRVDALSQGPMIEAGEIVKCVEVRAGTVIVRKLETTMVLSDL
jgi:membrane-bound ClpP family serine protease